MIHLIGQVARIMPGQDLARAFARKVTQVARAIRLPFIDAASVCDFGIDEIALHALQGLLAPEEMAGRELWAFVHPGDELAARTWLAESSASENGVCSTILP